MNFSEELEKEEEENICPMAKHEDGEVNDITFPFTYYNDLHDTLDKFSKWIDKLNLNIDNQRETYNKSGIGYERKNNTK